MTPNIDYANFIIEISFITFASNISLLFNGQVYCNANAVIVFEHHICIMLQTLNLIISF